MNDANFVKMSGLSKDFNASPACPYDKSGVKIMVRTEHF
jgi:hypothetical protein